MIDLIIHRVFSCKKILYLHKNYNFLIQIAFLKSFTDIISFLKPPGQPNVFLQISRALLMQFSFMNWFDVSFQTAFLWETVITNWAIVWFPSLMNWFHMYFQDIISWTTVITNWALVWFLSLMNWFNVCSNACFYWAGVITNWALMWFLFLMNWLDVSFQVSL